MRFGFREGWAYGGVVLGRCGISSVRCGLWGGIHIKCWLVVV